jgi:hypothetical protein
MQQNDRLYRFRNRKRSNLDELNLDPKEKSNFDEKVKTIMEKLAKVEY